jgi:hypothetical protein
MILYHGSNREIEHVDLTKCRPHRDFGRGFYLTVLKEQAWTMADRTARIYRTGSPCVTVFTVNDEIFTDVSFNVRRFTEPSDEWANFVVNNRNREFSSPESPECNTDNKYDMVVGPIANDRMTALFDLYLSGGLSQTALAAELTYKNLTNQISFHTERAIGHLVQIEVIHEHTGL